MTARPGEAGLTLAELLVALTLSLGVVLAAGRLLLLALDGHAVQAELAAVDDGGRFALELLGRALRQAGAINPDALGAATLPPRVTGLDARTLGRTTTALDDPLPQAVNGSDVLAVRFPGAGAGPAGDGSVLDCAGFPVARGEEGWSIFYVGRNAQGEAELRCKYRGAAHWSSDAVVAGLDGFQVLYGIDTDTPRDGTPNRYLNADAIAAMDEPASWWKRVVSLRVGLLLHGARPTRTAAQTGRERFYLLGEVYAGVAGADDAGNVLNETAFPPALARRERRLFTATLGVASPPP